MAAEIRAHRDQTVTFDVGNGELVRPGTVLYHDADNESDVRKATETGIMRWSVANGDSVKIGDVVGTIEEVSPTPDEDEEA